MKARPILFSGPMVQALLEGRKVQTRRIVKEPVSRCNPGLTAEMLHDYGQTIGCCPYGQPGDLLWVRECFFYRLAYKGVVYKAGISEIEAAGLGAMYGGWKPSIHMPRWASRLLLEITDVRIERLRDISAEDAIAEGIKPFGKPTGYLNYMHKGAGIGYYIDDKTQLGGGALSSYESLWESINGPGSWDKNPWIWAISFRVHQQNIDQFLEEQAA